MKKKLLALNCAFFYFRTTLSFLFVVASLTGLGQSPSRSINNNPLKAQASLLVNSVPQGSNSPLKIDLELAPDFHAYVDQFQLSLLEPEGLQLSQFEILPIVDFTDFVTKKIKKGVRASAQLKCVLGVPEGFSLGPIKAKLELTYQACAPTFCLLPKKLVVPLEFEVVESKVEPSPQGAHSEGNLFSQAHDKGWLFIFLTVFLAGLLTSFTPCVFPMIPITLAVIGSVGTKRSRLQNFGVSLVYVGGIALSYSLLGVGAALTGSIFGSILGHPSVAIGFAFIFTLMALGSFGLIEIQAPLFIRRRLGTYQSKSRWVGAFLSGLLAGVIAGPCVGPVLVAILAFVAQTKDPFMGFSLLFTFAVGMGQLFLALGLSTEFIHKLPKAGPWMNITKFAFGTTMMALALFYLRPITHPQLFDGLIGLVLILVSSIHGAFSPLQKSSPIRSLTKGFMLTGFLVGVLFVAKAFVPEPFKRDSNVNLPNEKSELLHGWQPFSSVLLDNAIAKNQPVIIDFYADWCVACKELETRTFSDPRVIQKIKNFLPLRFDATHTSEEFESLRQKFNILGLPTIVIYDGKEWRADLTLTGFEDANAFLKRLNLD
ncbi:MAG: sulfite exporter TauE/SafE family protein [Bdellovibrionales bacterium]|nr:sulfite exporter TauE/SafE family protein [Bdellovibrionales bacterium]